MIIVYESKTGFTKRYADMLAAKTRLQALSLKDFLKTQPDEEIIFMGWLKAGSIQGLGKVRQFRIEAVCCTGTAQYAEPDPETVIARNRPENKAFFYMRGGCRPLKQMKGVDRLLLSMFVSMLKKRKEPDEKTREAIANIENGFDGVKEENLAPVLRWVQARQGE